MSERDILESIKSYYELDKIDPNGYSPLSLAFIGDSVFGMIVKSVITMQANCPANQLNSKSVRYVKAVSQAKMYDYLEGAGILTSQEESIIRRGRNAKSANTAKNASVGDYRKATGLEALIGYLYLKGESDRAVELVHKCMNMLDAGNKEANKQSD